MLDNTATITITEREKEDYQQISMNNLDTFQPSNARNKNMYFNKKNISENSTDGQLTAGMIARRRME